MSKQLWFAVYDSKVQEYNVPFIQRSRGEALRAWQTIANDPQSQICKYPEDYTLFELGEYDSEKGQTKNHLTPVSLGSALEFKQDLSEKIIKNMESK